MTTVSSSRINQHVSVEDLPSYLALAVPVSRPPERVMLFLCVSLRRMGPLEDTRHQEDTWALVTAPREHVRGLRSQPPEAVRPTQPLSLLVLCVYVSCTHVCMPACT